MIFDWICYHTIVSYVYHNNDINEVIKNHRADQYKQFMKQMFAKKTIDENVKIDKLLKHLSENQIDIFFLQEASSGIIKMIEKKTNSYRIVAGRGSDSIILISWKLC